MVNRILNEGFASFETKHVKNKVESTIIKVSERRTSAGETIIKKWGKQSNWALLIIKRLGI